MGLVHKWLKRWTSCAVVGILGDPRNNVLDEDLHQPMARESVECGVIVYCAGWVALLGQLTDVGGLCKEKYVERFYQMKQCPDTYLAIVIEDVEKSLVVGSATLVLEQKFIHNAAIRGRVEDVVVCEQYRGQQLGKLLVEVLTVLSRQLGCYKVTLECKEENIAFYEPLGFVVDEQRYMVQRLT